jgi:hypothetical protein
MVRFPHRYEFGSRPTHTAVDPSRGMIFSNGTEPLAASLLTGASAFTSDSDYEVCIAANGDWIPGSPSQGSCGTLSGFATISFSGGQVSVVFNMNNFLKEAGLNVACSTSVQPEGIGEMTVKTGSVCLQT